jgi:TolA-binding protein
MFVTHNEDGGNDDGTQIDPAAAAAAGSEGGNDDQSKKPSDAEAKLLKEVMEKKDALKREKEARAAVEGQVKDLTGKLAQFEGIDLDQVKELLKERQERENAELEKRGEWDRLKQQMAEQHKKELDQLRAELATPVTELTERLTKREREIHELTIGRNFSESNFIRDDLTLTPSKARVIYGAHFELQDGRVVAYDKPAGSTERTPLVDANGDPLQFDKALEKLVELDPDRDNLLKSKMRSGAGSENDSDAKNKTKEPELRGKDRIMAALKAGQLPKIEIK